MLTAELATEVSEQSKPTMDQATVLEYINLAIRQRALAGRQFAKVRLPGRTKGQVFDAAQRHLERLGYVVTEVTYTRAPWHGLRIRWGERRSTMPVRRVVSG